METFILVSLAPSVLQTVLHRIQTDRQTDSVASSNLPHLLQQQASPQRDGGPQRRADEHAEEDLLRRGRRDEEDHQQGLVRVPGEEAQRRRHDGPLSCSCYSSLPFPGSPRQGNKHTQGVVTSAAEMAVV